MTPPSTCGCSYSAEAPSQQQSYLNLAKLSAIFAKQGGADCEDASYKATIDYLASTNADPSNAARPWVYQTCNEFGYVNMEIWTYGLCCMYV